MSANNTGEKVRAEVRRAVASLEKVEGLTLAELRAVLRMAITAATGHTRWVASVSAGEQGTADRMSITMVDGAAVRV